MAEAQKLRVRRVITTEREGRSMFDRVDEVEPIRLGGSMLRHMVWGWQRTPELPCGELPDFERAGMPAPGAVRVETWTLPPGFPLEGSHPDAGRMHATDTIDVMFVLEGRLCLRTADDPREVTLQRGDVLVQNGAVHTSRNPFDEPCVVAYVFFGTARRAAHHEEERSHETG